MISVVCPFFNEEAIIEASVQLMLRNLESLPEEWELIIVDDGSTDGSLGIARNLEQGHSRLEVVSYPVNRGRGYAIRAGVEQARGEIVVTTEIDSSWGDEVVHRIVAEFENRSDADIIVASPHLPSGGYKNVPAKRVFLSRFGNYLIRAGMTYSVTMNTGMTRGYRREKFQALPLDEDEKEMHLEIINKALAFGYRIYEVPAVLEWKDHKLMAKPGTKRKSSTNVNKTIRTHVLFSVAAAPFRFIFPVSSLLALLALGTFGFAVYRLFTPAPSIFWLLISFFLALFSFLLLSMGLLAHQSREIMRELWRFRSGYIASGKRDPEQAATRSDSSLR